MSDYCTPDAVKAALGISDGYDDDLVGIACGSASRLIERESGWRFWQDSTVTVRTYYPRESLCLDIVEDEYPGVPIASTSGLIVKVDNDDSGTFETTLTLNTDFILAPVNASADSEPWTEIVLTGSNAWFIRSAYRRPTVQVTALFGWPAVPDEITQAAVLIASAIYKTKDTVGGVLGQPGGNALTIAALDPTASLLVRSVNPRARIG